MVGGVQVVVPCEMLQGEGQVEATATPECSAEEESRQRQSIEEIARSTENRLADHLTIADLQAARQAFQTGVDPAGRKHLQEVLEAAGGQLDDTKRLRNLQDYLIPRGGCSPSLTARLNGVLQRANNVLKRVDEHFPEWREAYRLIYGKGP